MDGKQEDLPPHVLIFPVPIQGHINCNLQLAELLCLGGLHVTVLLSDSSYARLLRHSNVQSRFGRYPGFGFKTITDGLPEDHPRSGPRVMELVPSLKLVTGPLFREMMISTNFLASDTRRPVTCLIPDAVFGFIGDFALQMGIPFVYYRTVSTCSFWACYCLRDLIEAAEIPVRGNGLDLVVKSVPGMDGYIRRRDLPGYCRVDDINDSILLSMAEDSRQTFRAQGVIKNTFEDLEGPILSQVRAHCPNVFSIGPLHALIKARLAVAAATTASSASIWEEDRSCITWLDSQPSKSVIYVSFGSVTVVTREQLLEFWYGLVNSEQKFLWVMRPESIAGKNWKSGIPAELVEGTKERGYMVEWAPQEELLDHHAIGGFLTHSGWNSTLESIVAGVPMICWPYFADQLINSRFVSEVWKLGLDMKDTCDRATVEKMVRDLMDVKKDEFQQRAAQMAKLAKQAVSEGGSSSSNLDRLIDYIKSLIGSALVDH